MIQNNKLPKCFNCPSGSFSLNYIRQSRYMAICHAKECVLTPTFPDNLVRESQFITKANIAQVHFEPLTNCPHMEKLRAEHKIPWAIATIDFLNK